MLLTFSFMKPIYQNYHQPFWNLHFLFIFIISNPNYYQVRNYIQSSCRMSQLLINFVRWKSNFRNIFCWIKNKTNILFEISTSYGLIYHLWNLKVWFRSSFTSKRFLELIYCKKKAFSVIVYLPTQHRNILKTL